MKRMAVRPKVRFLVLLILLLSGGYRVAGTPQALVSKEGEVGRSGGQLTIALRSEPKTLNPILAVDATSREVISMMQADLVHINRETQRTEPALAKSWTISADGRRYTLQLRQGLKFSDGSSFTADDVVFSMRVYLDENLHSPQRDLLIVGGKPMEVKKVGTYVVEFDLAKPYGPAERLFDGLAILPTHLLEQPYREGKLGQLWSTNAQPNEIVGLGPFRLRSYAPGQHIVLERNPNYWKKDVQGNALPYVSEMTFLFVPNEDAQVLKFKSAETQMLERLGSDNFSVLQKEASKRNECLRDLGPGLETVFLLLNMNELNTGKSGDLTAKQEWFRDVRFRKAVSLSVDRAAMVRLVYRGRATPIWGSVTPGNKLWLNAALTRPNGSVEDARKELKASGFSWDGEGKLIDPKRRPVRFTILVSSSNQQRTKLATIAQDDLRQLGMEVQVVPMEFRALVDRVLNTKDYEVVLMNLVNGDADPTPEMSLWLSSGETHLWNLGQSKPSTPWEAEIDRLMEAQMTTTDYATRKKLYDQLQEVVAQNVPLVFLVSPNILVAARSDIGNFRPGILEPYALWNADQLFFRASPLAGCR